MAEVVNIPKSDITTVSNLTREHSSLEPGGISGLQPKENKKLELKGNVRVPNQSFARRLKETFIAEDARDVGDYILWDILVPTIKRTIRDIIVGSADRIFLGTSAPQKTSSLYRERGVTFVRNSYSGSSGPTSYVSSNSQSTRARTNFRLEEVVFDNLQDAQEVLEFMVDYLDTYHKVSVDAFFDAIGRTSPYTAQNWGWLSLSNASIVTSPGGGYIIKFPTPVVIK